MKLLSRLTILVLTVFVTASAIAQSQLPSCAGKDARRWTNCQGVHNFTNGDRYEGEWRDGKRSGQGVNLMANGNRYAGEFLDSRAHGLGTLVAPDGDVYKGTWTNGCFQQGNRRAVVGATAKECGFE